MRAVSSVFALFIALGLISCPASADKRVALVIGNSDYRNVPKLANPENDASAMSLLFKSSGFDVVETRRNLSSADLRSSIRDFSQTASDADIAVVFYAGHGIEVGGINFLIPVDAALRRDIDVEDEALSLDRVIALLEPARRLRLVILDACRDNPFAPNMARTLASRSIGRGLARIEPPSSDTLIAYAAKAGSVAADGSGANSPFTAALLNNLATPGLDIRLALGRVRDEVLIKTGRKQEPFVYGALGGSTISLVSLSTESRSDTNSSNPLLGADAQASRDYEYAAKLGTKEAWTSFLTKHSSGFYADLARGQLAKLNLDAPNSIKKPEGQKAKNAALPPNTSKSKEPKNNDGKKLSAQERCLAGVLRRQGRFMPEGQSSSCMWAAGPNGQLVRQGTCQKSRSDAVAMCRSGTFGGG